MMHIITADGGAWLALATIVGVRRSDDQQAVIKLIHGESVVSLEGYEPFVERLNGALLKAAGADDCAAEKADAWPIEALGARITAHHLCEPETLLKPALP